MVSYQILEVGGGSTEYSIKKIGRGERKFVKSRVELVRSGFV